MCVFCVLSTSKFIFISKSIQLLIYIHNSTNIIRHKKAKYVQRMSCGQGGVSLSMTNHVFYLMSIHQIHQCFSSSFLLSIVLKQNVCISAHPNLSSSNNHSTLLTPTDNLHYHTYSLPALAQHIYICRYDQRQTLKDNL